MPRIKSTNVIIIKPEHHSLWGKLDIACTELAMQQLSGKAFKLWARLCLNQNGQVRKLDADRYPEEFKELFAFGYLRRGAACDLLFTDDPTASEDAQLINQAWYDICTLYGKAPVDCNGDFSFVTRRLKEASLTTQTESVFIYWKAYFKELSESRSPSIQYPVRYDFATVLLWYLWDHFLFEPGDVLFVGKGGQNLHYNDAAVKAEIKALLRLNKAEHLVISKRTLEFWNKNFSARKIGVPPESIGEILRKRQTRN